MPSSHSNFSRRIRRVLILALSIYALWLLILYVAQDRMLFPREMARPTLPDHAIPAAIERLWITTPQGTKTEAWFYPAPSASPAAPAPAVLFAHGNAELIDDQLPLADAYRARGYSVLLLEYRGYGRSAGTPSQHAILADALRFRQLLLERPDVDPARLIYHGRSLGSGVAAQLAAVHPPAALILESPFKSVAAFSWRFGAPPFVIKHPFRTDRVLPTLDRPILLLHSRADEIVPFAHAEALHRLAPASTLVELQGGHNDVLMLQPAYWHAIDKLLNP